MLHLTTTFTNMLNAVALMGAAGFHAEAIVREAKAGLSACQNGKREWAEDALRQAAWHMKVLHITREGR